MRRDTDRAELFTRLSGWLEMPVEEMEERYDSRLYSRYRPMPLKEGVDENVAIALEERREDFPGVTIETDWRRGLSVRPAGQPRRRLHGLDHRGRRRALRGARLRHDQGRRERRPQRHRAEHGADAPRQVGRARWSRSTAATASCARSAGREPVNGMDIQLSIDLDLQQYAERVLQTQLRQAPPVHRHQPGWSRGSAPTARRRRARSTRTARPARRCRTRHRPAR